jgi:hypothetical protein
MHEDTVCILIIQTQVVISALYTATLAKFRLYKGTRVVQTTKVVEIVENLEKFEKMKTASHSLLHRLREVLEDDSLRVSFERFLLREFSIEPILFWKTIRKYRLKFSKDHMNNEEIRYYAKLIYEEFCKPESDFWINISEQCRENIEKALNTANPKIDEMISLFDEAEKQILDLLSNDTLARFLDQYKYLPAELVLHNQGQKV